MYFWWSTKRAGGGRADAWCAGGEGGKEPGDVADEVRARRSACGAWELTRAMCWLDTEVDRQSEGRYTFGGPSKKPEVL